MESRAETAISGKNANRGEVRVVKRKKKGKREKKKRKKKTKKYANSKREPQHNVG